MCQKPLHQSFRMQSLEEEQTTLAIEIFFIESVMVMVNNNHWKAAWKEIGEFGPGFSTPSYHTIRNVLLDKCYIEVKERIGKIILGNISLSVCMFVSVGWSNVQRRPLINVIVVCLRGETFIKVNDSSGAIKSGRYIFVVLINV
ncbi:hypothetical protein DD576_30420, partial [Klebsiella pneumoniae]|uniref:DUF domain-containing protein n=1 Tax=Klebsiella pneumoniae TaxID=573 RepID=UPI0010127C2C